MVTIDTQLVKDGNSTAVRLPKALLKMSGLQGSVQLEAKKGQIVIRQQKKQPREGWEEQIAQVLATDPHALDPDPELEAWDSLAADGLADLAWNGPTYEQWQKQQPKH